MEAILQIVKKKKYADMSGQQLLFSNPGLPIWYDTLGHISHPFFKMAKEK